MSLHDPRSAERRERLAELRRRDPECRLFGAGSHQYQSQPVDLVEIARVQAAMDMPIPGEYRNFLLDIGYGAGPYHGLWRPRAALDVFQARVRAYRTAGGVPMLMSAGFPVSVDDLKALEVAWAAGTRSFLHYDWPCGGCLPICHHGGAYWSVLVLKGAFAGRVWDLSCQTGFRGEWQPAARPTGRTEPTAHVDLPPLRRPPSFGEWIDGWLEQGLADLAAAGPATGSGWRWPFG